MPFQLNDYVRVKSGVLLEETDEPVPGWEGQITEIPVSLGDTTYLVELDALSLQQMPEKYLADCIEDGDIPIAYYFGEEDLEPSVRRDTDEQRTAAKAHLEDQIFPPDAELDTTLIAKWLNEFEQSMAKSIAMEALDAGVDLSDTQAMNGFIAKYNARLMDKLDFPTISRKKPQPLRPVSENPFKNISRNQVVKVKYPDGSIREGKFKRLGEELKAGKCTLM